MTLNRLNHIDLLTNIIDSSIVDSLSGKRQNAVALLGLIRLRLGMFVYLSPLNNRSHPKY